MTRRPPQGRRPKLRTWIRWANVYAGDRGLYLHPTREAARHALLSDPSGKTFHVRITEILQPSRSRRAQP